MSRSDEARLVLRCSKHPTYTAKRVPRVDCRACQELYRVMREEEALQLRFEAGRA